MYNKRINEIRNKNITQTTQKINIQTMSTQRISIDTHDYDGKLLSMYRDYNRYFELLKNVDKNNKIEIFNRLKNKINCKTVDTTIKTSLEAIDLIQNNIDNPSNTDSTNN